MRFLKYKIILMKTIICIQRSYCIHVHEHVCSKYTCTSNIHTGSTLSMTSLTSNQPSNDRTSNIASMALLILSKLKLWGLDLHNEKKNSRNVDIGIYSEKKHKYNYNQITTKVHHTHLR